MEIWNEYYFNIGVQVYIHIKENGIGDFQFGLVSCNLHGRILNHGGQESFEFTFSGSDECEPANGSGWVELKGNDKIQGEFRFHLGDSSDFSARKAKEGSLKQCTD